MEKIKGENIKNTRVSIYKNVATYLGETTIGWILTYGSELVKDKVLYLRENFEYHSDGYKQFKKDNMSAWISGGVVSNPLHRDTDIVSYSNVLCIDIDAADNINIDLNELKTKIFQYDWCYAVADSISGKGIYAIIAIENPMLTKEYYNYIVKLFKQLWNVNVDGQCKNIARLRFISYDCCPLIKSDDSAISLFNLVIQNTEYKPTTNEIRCEKPTLFHFDNNEENIKRTFKAMELIIENGYSVDNYGAWYHIGCELKNHPDGYNLFCKLSRNNYKYKDSQDVIDKKWKSCEATGIDDNLHKKWQGMLKNKQLKLIT